MNGDRPCDRFSAEKNLPQWPAFTPEDEICMAFGDKTGAAEHMDNDLMALTASITEPDPLSGR